MDKARFLSSKKFLSWAAKFKVNICYLPDGRSVLRKTVPEVLHKDRGQWPRSYID